VSADAITRHDASPCRSHWRRCFIPELSDEARAFLERPLVATIASLGRDGAPRTAPIWYQWAPGPSGEGAAYLFTSRRTLKWRNIERDPRVSLCVDDREVPYRSVVVDGVAVEDTERDLFELVSELALAYYGPDEGPPFAERYRGDRPDIVVFRIDPTRIATYLEAE
jgi:PPOX class probable F420-dependent enzyme